MKKPSNQHDTIPEIVTGLWNGTLSNTITEKELVEKIFGSAFTEEENRWCRFSIMYLTQAHVIQRSHDDGPYVLTSLGRKIRSHHTNVTRKVLRLWSKTFVTFDVPGPSAKIPVAPTKKRRRLNEAKIKKSVKALESTQRATTIVDEDEKFRAMLVSQRTKFED